MGNGAGRQVTRRSGSQAYRPSIIYKINLKVYTRRMPLQALGHHFGDGTPGQGSNVVRWHICGGVGPSEYDLINDVLEVYAPDSY